MYVDGKGGNLRLMPPDSMLTVNKFWELNAGDGNLRVFKVASDGTLSTPLQITNSKIQVFSKAPFKKYTGSVASVTPNTQVTVTTTIASGYTLLSTHADGYCNNGTITDRAITQSGTTVTMKFYVTGPGPLYWGFVAVASELI